MEQHDSEVLRIFNARYEPVGTASRRTVHEEGLWHETFHCWIVTRAEDGEGRLLFQRRSARKKVWPSRLDASAGGHLGLDEHVEAGVCREMKEEIGITMEEDRLVPLGMRVGVDEFVDGARNYELLHVFLTSLDPADADWRLQDTEVESLLQARVADLLRLFAREVERVPVDEIALTEAPPTGTVEITLDDFPETLDDYYYKVAILAGRMLRGERHLRI